MKLFYDNITIRPQFQNKLLNIYGYFRSLVKIEFHPIPENEHFLLFIFLYEIKILSFIHIII